MLPPLEELAGHVVRGRAAHAATPERIGDGFSGRGAATCDPCDERFGITAVLDLEIGHIGDPMMDLAAWRMRDTIVG